MVRKKGPVWKHFQIIGNNDKSHPRVQCKYCSKDFQRAVPERLQAHLNEKCPNAPNSAKSQTKQQKTISKIDNIEHMSEEEQESSKALTSSFKLSTREEAKIQTDDNEQLRYSGIEKDEIRAFELFKEAAGKGDIDAMNNLGKCYQNGIGTEKDKIRAFEMYKKAAGKGQLDAITKLGYCYEKGKGTEKDEIRAFELYQEAAKGGDLFALYMVLDIIIPLCEQD
ncbi:unnamed protein product [Rhizophagus irregularis]|nr:unnamed protein product [Rhizophagus irregularis]